MLRVGGAGSFELLGVENEEQEVRDGEREDREAEGADESGARGVQLRRAVALTCEPSLNAHCCVQLLGARQRLSVQREDSMESVPDSRIEYTVLSS